MPATLEKPRDNPDPDAAQGLTHTMPDGTVVPLWKYLEDRAEAKKKSPEDGENISDEDQTEYSRDVLNAAISEDSKDASKTAAKN